MSEQFSDHEPRPRFFDIDPHGAYLTALRDRRGNNVLLPLQRSVEGKKRGGSHVCLPNFGPGGETGLDQHGFGRYEGTIWDVVEMSDVHCVLTMPESFAAGSRSGYESLQATIRYAYSSEGGDEQLLVRLTVRHGGSPDSEPLPIAPGFHPYFAVTAEAVLDGRPLELDKLSKAEFIDGSTHMLETGTHQVVIHSEQLQRVAVWSGDDTEQDYVCVEPTQSGNSFESGQTEVMHMLLPDQQVNFEMVISWRNLD